MKRLYLSIVFSLLFLFSFCQSVPDMLENSLGAVVTVGVYKTDVAKHSLGFRGESAPKMAYEKALDMAEVTGSGSGFIIEKNGKLYVITNAHVVEDASNESGSIFIFSVNRSKYEVKLIGGDSFYDIAVLEFLDEPGSEISSVRFRDNDIRIGEKVYAIGNPLGEYPYTVTDGIISAKNRMRGGMTGKFGFLQTTATIIWGNSGGPLMDENGKVAGINSQIAFAETPNGDQILQSQINFALEAGISKRIVNDIITNNGRVKRAFIGLEISQKYGYEYTESYNYVPYEIDTYPIISGIIPGSAASKLLSDKIGWQIKKINGKEIRNLEEVLGELEKVKPGSSVMFYLENNGTTTDAPVNAAELTST
ncbi:MAG: trypsin-like peptidase domain-containing protein [Bacteroidales bacterium]|nr:trypsin-like peptidase domain-containing protein [Bacteroidales bacterium]